MHAAFSYKGLLMSLAPLDTKTTTERQKRLDARTGLGTCTQILSQMFTLCFSSLCSVYSLSLIGFSISQLKQSMNLLQMLSETSVTFEVIVCATKQLPQLVCSLIPD